MQFLYCGAHFSCFFPAPAPSIQKHTNIPCIPSGLPLLLLVVKLPSHVWLFCSPMDWDFSRQEYWSGLPFPFSRGSSRSKDRTLVSCLCLLHCRQILCLWATGSLHNRGLKKKKSWNANLILMKWGNLFINHPCRHTTFQSGLTTSLDPAFMTNSWFRRMVIKKTDWIFLTIHKYVVLAVSRREIRFLHHWSKLLNILLSGISILSSTNIFE